MGEKSSSDKSDLKWGVIAVVLVVAWFMYGRDDDEASTGEEVAGATQGQSVLHQMINGDESDAAAAQQQTPAAKPETRGPQPTAREIRTNLSDQRTEAQREVWWDRNMAGRPIEYVGTVDDVEKGFFSGGSVRMILDGDLSASCDVDDAGFEIAITLNKGQAIQCRGTASSSYVKFFGAHFQINDGVITGIGK